MTDLIERIFLAWKIFLKLKKNFYGLTSQKPICIRVINISEYSQNFFHFFPYVIQAT